MEETTRRLVVADCFKVIGRGRVILVNNPVAEIRLNTMLISDQIGDQWRFSCRPMGEWNAFLLIPMDADRNIEIGETFTITSELYATRDTTRPK